MVVVAVDTILIAIVVFIGMTALVAIFQLMLKLFIVVSLVICVVMSLVIAGGVWPQMLLCYCHGYTF